MNVSSRWCKVTMYYAMRVPTAPHSGKLRNFCSYLENGLKYGRKSELQGSRAYANFFYQLSEKKPSLGVVPKFLL